MRVTMRTYVAVGDDYDVDLKQLPPLEMVSAGIRARYLKSKSYQRRVEKEKNIAREKRQKDMEDSKKGLLYRIQHSLVKNEDIGDANVLVEEILVYVDRAYDYILTDVLKEKEFLAYNIRRKEENPDMLTAFPTMKICLVISKKIIETKDDEII